MLLVFVAVLFLGEKLVATQLAVYGPTAVALILLAVEASLKLRRGPQG